MLAGWFGQSGPRTISAQHVIDRVRHLNLVFGYLLPSLTHVLSLGTVDGANFLFRPFTDDADRIRASYEPIVRRLVSPQLDEVIVDVGANIGSHSIWFAKKVGPSGLVLAIEPESNNFTILCSNQNINHLTNVVPIKAALSSDQSVGTLVVPLPTFMGQEQLEERLLLQRALSSLFTSTHSITYCRLVPYNISQRSKSTWRAPRWT